MRILFSSLPTHGHTYPLVPLAVAARNAGHDVTFATCESFHPTLKSFGLDTIAAGKGVFESFAEANGSVPDQMNMTEDRRIELAVTVFGSLLPRSFHADLAPVLERTKPDVFVYESGNFGALVAARQAGIPRVCHGFGRVSDGFIGHAIGQGMMAFAEEVGIPPEEAKLGVDRYLDIYPESMQGADFVRTANRLPLRPVPVSEPGELPASVLSPGRGRPLVYLTLGTAFNAVPVLKKAIDGLAALEVDVLVAAGPRIDVASFGEVPDNVQLVAWAPQAELLPHVDLVVHHGGSGTTLGALANAVPQLVLPQGADQFINAEAVVAAGAGVQLARGEQSAEAVATTVRQLLGDDAVRAASHAIAAEIVAMPSPEATVAVLPEIASR